MNDPKPPFKLSLEDRESLVWKRLMTHFGERLEVLRTQNDGDKSEAETAKLRGRIAELKAILALNKELIDL